MKGGTRSKPCLLACEFSKQVFENLIIAKWNSMRHAYVAPFPECAHEDDIELRKWIKSGMFDYLRVKLLVK